MSPNALEYLSLVKNWFLFLEIDCKKDKKKSHKIVKNKFQIDDIF